MVLRLLAAALLVAVLPAQDLNLARAAARVDATIPWITDGFFAPDPGGPVPTLPKTEIDRGALIDGALAKARAEGKPVFWYVPRIEGVQMYRSPILDDYMRTTAFTDRRLAGFIAAMCVPVRCAVDKAGLGKRFGIVAPDNVEPMIVMLAPDGNVLWRLDHIRTINAEWLLDRVMRVCAALSGKPIDLSPWLPAAATPAAAATNDAVRARLARDADAVRKALERARAADPTPAESARIDLEEAKLSMNLGVPKDAIPGLRALVKSDSALSAEGMPEALEALALAERLTRNDSAAERLWRRLVDEFPTSSEAAKASTNLIIGRDTTPVGPVVHAFEDPVWPPAAAMSESLSTTAWPRSPAEARSALPQSIAWLLRHQNASGGWQDARYAYWDSPRIIPNVHVAATAAAMNALLAWRDTSPTEIDAALKRGEVFLANDKRMARGQNEECYADAFRLMYLARRIGTLRADDPTLPKYREDSARIVKELARQQREDGSWGHEYPNPFTTAGVVLALDDARRAGVAVPESVFARAAEGMASVRSEEGSFAYGMGRKPGKGEEALKNAMARMPACEAALLLGKKGDPTALAAAMENFWKYLPRFERIRTCDFHTDGELGGFFFWHGALFTARAVDALPPAAAKSHRAKMVEHVMTIGEWDGTWIDSHEMGKSYGTAMALLTLKQCLEDGP